MREIWVKTQVIKNNCTINEPKKDFINLYKSFFWFVLNIIHGWGAADFRIGLAPKYHGYSISTKSYEFCLHLAQLDFRLSHNINNLYIVLKNIYG